MNRGAGRRRSWAPPLGCRVMDIRLAIEPEVEHSRRRVVGQVREPLPAPALGHLGHSGATLAMVTPSPLSPGTSGLEMYGCEVALKPYFSETLILRSRSKPYFSETLISGSRAETLIPNKGSQTPNPNPKKKKEKIKKAFYIFATVTVQYFF